MIGEKPYLYPAGFVGRLAVWVVDGEWIRNNKDIEFTDWGQHYDKHYVPKGEVWIDYGADDVEVGFFAKSAAKEYRLMASGMSYARAEEIADETERARRKGDRAGPIKLELWCNIADIQVWIVNGRAVRDEFDVDYTEGGHDRVYAWIPAHQIWIDNTVQESERRNVLFHELFERNKMGAGWPYPRAHKAASKDELKGRRHPDLFDAMFEKEVELASEQHADVALWRGRPLGPDKPIGVYRMEDAACLMALEEEELRQELVRYGYMDVNGLHAEFYHTEVA